MRRAIPARTGPSAVTAICVGGHQRGLGQNVHQCRHAVLMLGGHGENLGETSHRDAPWFSWTVEQRQGGRDNSLQEWPFRPHAGEDVNPHELPEKMMGERLRRQRPRDRTVALPYLHVGEEEPLNIRIPSLRFSISATSACSHRANMDYRRDLGPDFPVAPVCHAPGPIVDLSQWALSAAVAVRQVRRAAVEVVAGLAVHQKR
jgi:hypothetical protein